MSTRRHLIARLAAALAAAATTFAVLTAVVSLSEPAADGSQQLATIASTPAR